MINVKHFGIYTIAEIQIQEQEADALDSPPSSFHLFLIISSHPLDVSIWVLCSSYNYAFLAFTMRGGPR